jgi:hypothetical protein
MLIRDNDEERLGRVARIYEQLIRTPSPPRLSGLAARNAVA